MREAFVATWNGHHWCPKSNDPEKGLYDLMDVPWPTNPRYTLVIPRFNLGETIRYEYWGGYREGRIIKIRAYFDISPKTVVYTVRNIGHLCDIFDDGTKDITLVKGLYS